MTVPEGLSNIESALKSTDGIGRASSSTEPTDNLSPAETCASVALIFWAQRMLHLDLDGKYADVLELALYNGALSGLSRDGQHYFYANPLESDGSAERWAWHTCPCCTMNVSRLVASVGGYFISTAEDGVAFHIYGGISATREIAGSMVVLRETSNYPWSGDIRIAIDPEAPTNFDVKLASLDALDAVRGKTDRVCPLSCAKGQRAEGERCIQIGCRIGFFLNSSGSCEKRPEPTPKARTVTQREPAAQRWPGSSAKGKCFAFNGKTYCE